VLTHGHCKNKQNIKFKRRKKISNILPQFFIFDLCKKKMTKNKFLSKINITQKKISKLPTQAINFLKYIKNQTTKNDFFQKGTKSKDFNKITHNHKII
jgi:hypothetical protein